jgi:ribonuclease VapC
MESRQSPDIEEGGIVILLDASAVIALVHGEEGGAAVAEALSHDDGAITLVNLAEVLEKVERTKGGSAGNRLGELRSLFSFVSITEDDALRAAELYPLTRRPALSLADRLALATAGRMGVPIFTAERAWADVPGVDVRVIR